MKEYRLNWLITIQTWLVYVGWTFSVMYTVILLRSNSKTSGHTKCAFASTSTTKIGMDWSAWGYHFILEDYTKQNLEAVIILRPEIPKEMLTNQGTSFMSCTLQDAIRITRNLSDLNEHHLTTCITDGLVWSFNRWVSLEFLDAFPLLPDVTDLIEYHTSPVALT